MTPEELVQTACPPIAALGGLFYFDPATVARGKEHGLDGMRFYILGRGGVLGDVEPAVVQSAFGYFSAGVITKLWNSAKEKVAPRDAGRLYHECAATYGRERFDGIELSAFCAAGDKVLEAAHPAGFSLFAGWAAEPISTVASSSATTVCPFAVALTTAVLVAEPPLVGSGVKTLVFGLNSQPTLPRTSNHFMQA